MNSISLFLSDSISLSEREKILELFIFNGRKGVKLRYTKMSEERERGE